MAQTTRVKWVWVIAWRHRMLKTTRINGYSRHAPLITSKNLLTGQIGKFYKKKSAFKLINIEIP
jgi:hypothetical protein